MRRASRCDGDHAESVTTVTVRRYDTAVSLVLERIVNQGPNMSMTHVSEAAPRPGDHVILRGTRIVGDVAHVEDEGRISVKVTAVVGKSSTSKAARAWRGAWVTCPPTMVATVAPSTN